MATRSMTETRRRPRREASSSSSRSDAAPRAGEAHYRDFVLQLQGEFARVVDALEARATALQELNEELQHEVVSLRDELTSASQRAITYESAVREAQEQAAMAWEESASQATSADEWRAQFEQLTQQLQSQQKQFDMERTTMKSEQERTTRELSKAAAQLAQEQQRNAHMSQEVQLLQCRVDSAVKTSRSFEARLQQLKQLKRDEKSDSEAQVAHLKARLEDKKEQNRYLAEALMDKEARRAARKERDQQQQQRGGATSDTSIASNDTAVNVQRKHHAPVTKPTEPVKTTPSTRYQLPEAYEEKKMKSHRYLYEGSSPLSGLLEDLCSHAPTSPTSSASPARSPRSSSTVSATTAPTARMTHRTLSRPSSPTDVVRTSRNTKPSTTTPPPTTRTRDHGTVQSDRLKRELDSLRRKMNACYAGTSDNLSPH